MDNFKIDQPGPIGPFIINHIGHARIAVGPRSPEFFGPELMRSSEFGSGCFHHSPSEWVTIQVFPEALAR